MEKNRKDSPKYPLFYAEDLVDAELLEECGTKKNRLKISYQCDLVHAAELNKLRSDVLLPRAIAVLYKNKDDHMSLLSPGEATSGVLCLALGCPVRERHGHAAVSVVESQGMTRGLEPLSSRGSGRAGIGHPERSGELGLASLEQRMHKGSSSQCVHVPGGRE